MFGETSAELSYALRSARIMNTTYTVSDELTSSQLETILATNYPFTITIDINTDNLQGENLIGEYVVTFSWDFESGDDALDTLWGNNAYQFNNSGSNLSFITLELDLIASQSNGE